MSDPSAAVRAAFLARLRTALTGVAKAYDEVPATRTWPYVALRSFQTVPDDVGCTDVSEIFIDFDAWSQKLDHSETGAIANTVRQALRADLIVAGHAVLVQVLESVQFTGDPDPAIARAAMTLRLETQPV